MLQTLRDRGCDIIVLNVLSQTEDKSDDMKGGFYEVMERVFPQYHMNILLGDFNGTIGGEDISN
jgi:hypothetical protein